MIRKLDPQTYSLKQAEIDLESCNQLIVKKIEQAITMQQTSEKLQEDVVDLRDKKIYIKSILRKKKNIMKKNRSRKRIDRLLKK